MGDSLGLTEAEEAVGDAGRRKSTNAIDLILARADVEETDRILDWLRARDENGYRDSHSLLARRFEHMQKHGFLRETEHRGSWGKVVAYWRGADRARG